jgi:hypothetical protein
MLDISQRNCGMVHRLAVVSVLAAGACRKTTRAALGGAARWCRGALGSEESVFGPRGHAATCSVSAWSHHRVFGGRQLPNHWEMSPSVRLVHASSVCTAETAWAVPKLSDRLVWFIPRIRASTIVDLSSENTDSMFSRMP